MTRHARINSVIVLLQQGPQTVESLVKHFSGKVSARQVRGDIDAIKALVSTDHPEFEKTGAANQKTWHIKPSDYDWNTQRLNRAVLPRVFALKRHRSLEKLNGWLAEEPNPTIESTHFYETEANERLDKGLETVIRAIDNGRKLRISNLTGDATSVLQLVRFPVTVLPVRILYHRGCFYVAAVTDETHQVMTFQIDQLEMQESVELFQRVDWVNLVEKDLRNRFGVTQNIDDKTYEIKLRFSSITSEFVKNQFWHDEQSKAIRDGSDWLVTFHCGLNRELVGWLFQWMSNVQVIGPPKLKELYNEQLARMLTIMNQLPDEPLAYNNAFAPIATFYQ